MKIYVSVIPEKFLLLLQFIACQDITSQVKNKFLYFAQLLALKKGTLELFEGNTLSYLGTTKPGCILSSSAYYLNFIVKRKFILGRHSMAEYHTLGAFWKALLRSLSADPLEFGGQYTLFKKYAFTYYKITLVFLLTYRKTKWP